MSGLSTRNHGTGNAVIEMKALEINQQILTTLRNLEGTSFSGSGAFLALKYCLTKGFFWNTKMPSYLKIANHKPLA